ncbi:hypothetical protein ONV78_07595 [Hahella sp. CR1]|uniref:hypothetical protein n=1 Tax=Hahella sp. CR1 TaxID=2992807 RepID=UPI0024424D4D|nr:hypothetical protein [Hahella sp. CR1]MDG9667589.1 hypothetical protein [Hahella sp. CR1]
MLLKVMVITYRLWMRILTAQSISVAMMITALIMGGLSGAMLHVLNSVCHNAGMSPLVRARIISGALRARHTLKMRAHALSEGKDSSSVYAGMLEHRMTDK